MRHVPFVLFALLLLAGCSSSPHGGALAPASLDGPDGIKSDGYRLEPAYLVTVHVPNAEVDKVLAAIVAAVGLPYGKYDHVAFIDAAGLEQFRPLADSKAGAQAEAGRAPTTRVSFSLSRDQVQLKKALDAIHLTHSYEEPVIYIREVWRSRATNVDAKNPHKWWNQPKG